MPQADDVRVPIGEIAAAQSAAALESAAAGPEPTVHSVSTPVEERPVHALVELINEKLTTAPPPADGSIEKSRAREKAPSTILLPEAAQAGEISPPPAVLTRCVESKAASGEPANANLPDYASYQGRRTEPEVEVDWAPLAAIKRLGKVAVFLAGLTSGMISGVLLHAVGSFVGHVLHDWWNAPHSAPAPPRPDHPWDGDVRIIQIEKGRGPLDRPKTEISGRCDPNAESQ
ncbi:MAG: hypothetical protein WDO17_02695 [Alphaproteobacteria bacterium]